MIEVLVRDRAWRQAGIGLPRAIREAAKLALAGDLGRRDVTIVLSGDAAVAALNARFRGKPGPTNVLSFPAAGEGALLGEVILAFGVVAAEAAAQGKSLMDHARHLVIHGVLHLAGHDHEREAEAQAMEALETRLLARLGVADPYAAEGADGRG